MSLVLTSNAFLDSNFNFINLNGGQASVMVSPSDSFYHQYNVLNNLGHSLLYTDNFGSNNAYFTFSSNSTAFYINSNIVGISNVGVSSNSLIQIKKNLYSYSLYFNNSNVFNVSLSNYLRFDGGLIQFSGNNIVDNWSYTPIQTFTDPVNFNNTVMMSNLMCNKFASPELSLMSNLTISMSNIIYGSSNQPQPYSFCNIQTFNMLSSNDVPLSVNPCLPQNYQQTFDTLTNISQLSSNQPVKSNQPMTSGWGWNYLPGQYVDIGPQTFTPGNGFTLMTKFQWSPSNNSSNQTIYKTTSSALSNNQDSLWLYCFQNTIGNAIQADCYNSNVLGARLTSYGWSNNTPYSVAVRYNNVNSNYSLFVNGSNVTTTTGIFTLSNKQFTNTYCGLDYFSGSINGINLYPYVINDINISQYHGMTQDMNTLSPYRLPEGFRNIGVDFTPQSTNFRTSISNINNTFLGSNVYSAMTLSNFGNMNIGSNLIVNQSLSNLGPGSFTSNVIINQSLSNQGPASFTSNVVIGQSLSNQGPASFTSNVVIGQSLFKCITKYIKFRKFLHRIDPFKYRKCIIFCQHIRGWKHFKHRYCSYI
ncbi:MAG: hypothetical protein EOP34_04425 [Rickettsiales bacterium]|nr:MAG: hypothetical protein EOP34_04425 [Rickettsiales bacterium]